MIIRFGAAALVTVLLFSLGCSEESVPVVELPPGEQVHRLIAIDSIGVADGDTTLMFGQIWGSDYTPEGDIAVLDKTAGSIRFFSPDGVCLRTFTPYGEGPGEFISLDRMSFDNDGNLYLGSFYDRKMCLYDSDLNLLKEIKITSSYRTGVFKMYPGPDQSFIGMTWVFDGDSMGTEVCRFDSGEIPGLVYRRRMVLADESYNYQRLTGMIAATDASGRVFIADAVDDKFSIICYSPEGDSLFEFGFSDYEPREISQQERDLSSSRVLEQYIERNGTAEGFSFEPAQFYRPISAISMDAQNRIWVREEWNSSIAYIFDEEGEYLFKMETALPNWQSVMGWNIRVSPRGILADPRNPGDFPLVYMMQEEISTAE